MYAPSSKSRRTWPFPRALAMLERSRRIVGRLDSIIRPRAPRLLHPWHLRLVAAGCVVLTAVLLTPVPIAHTAAALGIVAFAAGLVQRDGVALLCGWGLTLGCTNLLVLIGGVVMAGANSLGWLP